MEINGKPVLSAVNVPVTNTWLWTELPLMSSWAQTKPILLDSVVSKPQPAGGLPVEGLTDIPDGDYYWRGAVGTYVPVPKGQIHFRNEFVANSRVFFCFLFCFCLWQLCCWLCNWISVLVVYSKRLEYTDKSQTTFVYSVCQQNGCRPDKSNNS